MQLPQRVYKIGLMIALVVSLSSCQSLPKLSMPKPVSPQTLRISWQEEPNGRLSISKEDAVKLEQWLIDVEFYLEH